MAAGNSDRFASLSRRGFMASASAAAVGLGASSALQTATGYSEGEVAVEPWQWALPVARDVDVLVCGGGPAGCAAALYAARAGARTLLLENLPFLGGVWTAVGISHLIAGAGRDGLNAELHQRLPVHRVFGRYIYVIEDMKCLLDDLLAEAGVETQFYTRAVAAAADGPRLRGVLTASKSGLEFIRARVIIDATGDGDVAAAAGCQYDQGREFDGRTQPVTLYGTVGGYRGEPAKGAALVEILERGGWQPSYPPVTLFPQPGQPGVFQLMATQFYGIDGTDARQLSRAEIEGRREIRKCVAIFRQHGGPDWKDVFLIKTGPAIGVRATRRIRGLYRLTWEDLDRGAQFEDGITDITSASNIHSVDDPYQESPEDLPQPPRFRVRPYQIPYRALVAADVENLLLAGRCISGDRYALGSYRLTGNVVRTGEAAGVAAALAIQTSRPLAELEPGQLRDRLHQMRATEG